MTKQGFVWTPPSLNVGSQTLTTHTDFLNKHTSQLQTTCYNFTKTSTTSEICGGVEICVECFRVDGAAGEGPSHVEVQFLWTERHIKRPTKVTLVTTRSSGDSFF